MASRRDVGKGLLAAVAMTPFGLRALRSHARGGRGGVLVTKSLAAGMNLSAGGSGATYFEGLPIYKNRIRESKGFFVAGSGTTLATVSANGWPTQDFEIFLNAGNFLSTRGEWAAGTWKCGFIGTGAETVTGVNGATATVTTVGTGGAYTLFNLTGVGTNAGFQVTDTTGGVTNVFAYLPAYPASTIDNMLSPSAFTNEAIATYSKAAYVRCMDWTGCVFNATTMTSANRAKPSNTQCFYHSKASGLEGLPLECHIAFCLACNTVRGINLPNLFDSSFTYITDLGNAINALLPAGQALYVEESDELWNNEGAGIAAWAAAAAAFSSTGNYVYYSYQHHNIASILQSIFGSRYGTDIRLVSAWQSAGNGVSFRFHVRSYYLSQGWSISNDFYSTSIAPYLNTGYSSAQFSNTIAQIQATLQSVAQTVPLANTPSSAPYAIEAILCMGLKDGLSMLCYEGGWQTNTENAGLLNAGAAIMDSGMIGVMEAYYQGIINSGAKGVPQWTGVNINTNTNLTPINESSNDWQSFVTSGSPRQAAIIATNATPPVPTRNVVNGSGSVIQGNCYIDNASGVAATLGGSGFAAPAWAPNYSVGNQATYLINCLKAGTYTVVGNLTNSGGSPGATGLEWAGEKHPFQTSGAVSIPVGTNNVTLGSVTLVLGANYICLTGNGTNQSSVSINTLTFN